MGSFDAFMEAGGWAVFSLIATVFIAVYFLLNQYLKQPGYLLVFWMRVLVVLCMSPFVLHLPWPEDPRFYGAVFLTAIFGNFADIRTFNVSAKYGAGVTSRVQPVVVWTTFFLWFLFDPQLLLQYIRAPLNTLGILAALGGCVYFAMRLNKCVITRAALVEMLPALGGYTVSTVLNKYAMGHGNMAGAVFGYMYFQSAVAVALTGVYAMWRMRREGGAVAVMPAPRLMASAALIAGFSWGFHMIFKNYAMVFTPNPSYQAAIHLTGPLFIALYYKYVNHREEADTRSGYGVVACAMLLVLFTAR